MALATTISTTTGVLPVNFVYQRGLLRAAERCFPYFNGTLPTTLQKNQGSMTAKWQRIENLATVTTALGDPPSPTVFGAGRDSVVPTISNVTVAIAKYGNAINVGEEVDLFNINTGTMQFVEKLGENAGASLNELMRDVYDAETTTRFANGSATGDVNTTMSLNDIKYCVNQLQRQSAMKQFAVGTGSENYNTNPIRASFFGICHVDIEEDIRLLTGFIPVEQYAGYTDTFYGEFGAVGGVRWCSTEVAPIDAGGGASGGSGVRETSSDADVYSTFIYGKEAVGSVGLSPHTTNVYDGSKTKHQPVELIHHKPGSAGAGDPFNEVGTLAWKAWFAGKVLNSNWVTKIESAASTLA